MDLVRRQTDVHHKWSLTDLYGYDLHQCRPGAREKLCAAVLVKHQNSLFVSETCAANFLFNVKIRQQKHSNFIANSR